MSSSITFCRIQNIDYSACRAEMGYPSPLTASMMWKDEAEQSVLNYLEAKSASGDALGAIEKGSVSIGDVAESESFTEPPEVNIDAVPKTPPRITFEYGEVNFEFTPLTIGTNFYISTDIPQKGESINQIV
ncbi:MULTISPECIES: DUF6470 family protein [Tepidanaerobacter]|uniref:Uncharacterized protein n=1 Tax=Tepidanaerobacter syntrophicus TaxID=224999 RepID=A0A0U9HES3_9FIRM|nr:MULTISPECIES: DUF6470 family protein [Tepidanaerobacter]GAQ24372.1 hypothetical protein TSYNT_5198 [Tepidanaerobacter syntrophicus]GLI18336.1 hypothetical protein TSYNTROPHJE_01490 [Tepidanaerobacter syntrophicus]GLI52106.1 hypothetical protein TSYNTROOL_21920 [Tepidanaerobacter syntrophicus]